MRVMMLTLKSQVATGASPPRTLTQVFREEEYSHRISYNLWENLAMTTTEIVAYLAERYGYQISRADA